jgi:hypothetical protein
MSGFSRHHEIRVYQGVRTLSAGKHISCRIQSSDGCYWRNSCSYWSDGRRATWRGRTGRRRDMRARSSMHLQAMFAMGLAAFLWGTPPQKPTPKDRAAARSLKAWSVRTPTWQAWGLWCGRSTAKEPTSRPAGTRAAPPATHRWPGAELTRTPRRFSRERDHDEDEQTDGRHTKHGRHVHRRDRGSSRRSTPRSATVRPRPTTTHSRPAGRAKQRETQW